MTTTPYREKWVSDCGTVTLYCGDCLEVLPTLEAGSVDAVVTDPPYGIELGKTKGTGGSHGMKIAPYASYDDTYTSFCDAIVPRLNLAIGMAKRAIVWTGPHIHEQKKPDVIGGVYVPSGAGRHNWGFKTFLPFLLYGNGPDIHKGAPYPTCIQSGEKPEKNGHPCPKPLEWMVWNVNLASRKPDMVMDPFMGSGTTGVACVRLGRRFIGIELEPKYFAISKRRIIDELNRVKFLEPPKRERQKQLIETE